jgi:hypothetical protein
MSDGLMELLEDHALLSKAERNALFKEVKVEIERLQEAKRRALALADERALQANDLAQALDALANAEALAVVRKIVSGWNGDGREGAPFKRHPDNLAATIPKTRCKAIYDLDDAIERAKALLTYVEIVKVDK